MDGLSDLLEAARAAGLTVRADGDRLTIRGLKDAADLAKRMLDRKGEVLALLRAEAPSVCSWGTCGQPVLAWESDPTHPGLQIQQCQHHHNQRQVNGEYWRTIEQGKGV